jgi:hypothetical protein
MLGAAAIMAFRVGSSPMHVSPRLRPEPSIAEIGHDQTAAPQVPVRES